MTGHDNVQYFNLSQLPENITSNFTDGCESRVYPNQFALMCREFWETVSKPDNL